MNGLVSVVVPIYNVEKYIEKCVTSIINQTYQNLEIILVDDGSPDNCPEICDNFSKSDSRVKVVHKQNQGLGMARNTGIDNATGKYICFFDGDDYIEPDTIEACVTAMAEHEADIVIFGYDSVTLDGAVVSTHCPCVSKKVFSGLDITSDLLPKALLSGQNIGEDWKIGLSSCNKLYSLDVIKECGWRFVSERDIISEDYYSLTELHKYLQHVFILDKVFYHYVVNQSSLSRKFNPNRFERIKNFHSAMIKLSENMGLCKTLEQPIKCLTFGLVIGAMKQISKSALSLRQRYKEIKNIVNDSFLQDLVKTTDYSEAGFQKKLLYKMIASRLALICFILVSLKN